ncbi:hypothetical protein O53_2694 [Microcystis aeruginosa TAIHU98]|uniref:Uncharacterized protein n=1 Tax=Microcystis aeruginosa TAIHU98 TaxID=1134457 RepID=L7E5F6_MICAE|nr:hypothetical protein O53_2694 [Microcystis aeruginosa TAIHU98]
MGVKIFSSGLPPAVVNDSNFADFLFVSRSGVAESGKT